MLLRFLIPLPPLFHYITLRTVGGLVTSLLVSFLIGPGLIRFLKKKQKEGQPIRLDGPKNHIVNKKGTPTMGGVLILLSLTLSIILWGDLSNPHLLIAFLGTLGFGVIGACDDFLKLTKRSHQGLSGRFKLLAQIFLSVIICVTLVDVKPILYFPFFKNVAFSLGFFFPVWGAFVIVGTSNAVNLTDGLDGLAIVPVIIAASCFSIICYAVGHKVFSDYLFIPHIEFCGELSVFLGSLVGSGLGFLWFNAPPARVFMGDTGSLATGGALGIVGVISKHEIVLAIVGGVFVLEAVSVIIQVAYFKRTGKRIFLMAPIHHHFEKKGWSEPTIVIRFWIIAAILGLLGLVTLKIR